MEDKKTHLGLIQGVINRMAGNSFLLKGWSVTLVSAIFALAAKDNFKAYIILTFIPAIMFWILDAYFLRQERLFRKLYDSVRINGESSTDYSMDTRPFQPQVSSWFKVMFSNTLLIFYGTLILTIIIMACVLLYKV